MSMHVLLQSITGLAGKRAAWPWYHTPCKSLNTSSKVLRVYETSLWQSSAPRGRRPRRRARRIRSAPNARRAARGPSAPFPGCARTAPWPPRGRCAPALSSPGPAAPEQHFMLKFQILSFKCRRARSVRTCAWEDKAAAEHQLEWSHHRFGDTGSVKQC
jgi:hypothetical protein